MLCEFGLSEKEPVGARAQDDGKYDTEPVRRDESAGRAVTSVAFLHSFTRRKPALYAKFRRDSARRGKNERRNEL